MEHEVCGDFTKRALRTLLSAFWTFTVQRNICGKRQTPIVMVIPLERLRCGSLGYVINYIMGLGKRIIKEFNWLSKSKNTTEAIKPTLRQVRDYLNTRLDHIQYRSFNKLGLPIGSGTVESACKSIRSWCATYLFSTIRPTPYQPLYPHYSNSANVRTWR